MINHLVAIVGPTGVGKSGLALKLTQAFGGEIVGADSRQVYRYLDTGTAKPGPRELSIAPHYLINIVNPDEDFSLAQYQELAYQAIDSIIEHRRLPLLVGGSGLYIWSVLEGWSIPQVPPNRELRYSLEEKAARVGRDELYRELMAADPIAAQRIGRRNVRRIIRALEVTRGAGIAFSQLQRKQPPPYDTLIIGLTADRAKLYRRIDLRVDKMIEKGLVAEVQRLVSMGYSLDLPAMSGIGYRQIGMFLKGEIGLEAAIRQIKFENHRLVRHQYNWFKLRDERIHWFDIGDEVEGPITALVKEFVSKSN